MLPRNSDSSQYNKEMEELLTSGGKIIDVIEVGGKIAPLMCQKQSPFGV